MSVMRRLWWLPLLALGLATVRPAAAFPPEQDIVAVEAATPLSGEEDALPGLLDGQRIMNGITEALDLVRGGVPEAARPGLEDLVHEMERLEAGEVPGSPLPADDWRDGELWLPVKVESLRVTLDAPDLHARPWPGSAGGEVANLAVRARRTGWIPVGTTRQRIRRALPLSTGGEPGSKQTRQELEAALNGVRDRIELADRPLIVAYYRVEEALAAVPDWTEEVRDHLRQGAAALSGEAGLGSLAEEVQTQSDQLSPAVGALQSLALKLRKRIESGSAKPSGNGDGKPAQ